MEKLDEKEKKGSGRSQRLPDGPTVNVSGLGHEVDEEMLGKVSQRKPIWS